MRLWDRQCCWDCRTPKDYPTVHRTVGWELLAFLVGLMGIPMECPMCQQGTWDVLSGQGMLKANLDMSAPVWGFAQIIFTTFGVMIQTKVRTTATFSLNFRSPTLIHHTL